MPTAKNFAVTPQVIGATFNTEGRANLINGKSTNSKRAARFGITKEAVGPTINVNDGALGSFPNANKKPPMTKDTKSGTGTYKPMKSGPVDMIHNVVVKGHR